MGFRVVTDGLDRLRNTVRGMVNRVRDVSPALERTGEELREESERALSSRSYAPLSPLTRELDRRHGRTTGKPLQRLQGTIRTRVDRLTLRIGSTHPWAARLHFGGNNVRVFGNPNLKVLPARPFLPIDSQGNVTLTLPQKLRLGRNVFVYIFTGARG